MEIVQVWSNDEYESVEYRVIVNLEKERYSYSFFLLLALSTVVKLLDELTNEQNPAKAITLLNIFFIRGKF